MNLTKYSFKNIESQLEHVCGLIDLVKGDRGFREAIQDTDRPGKRRQRISRSYSR